MSMETVLVKSRMAKSDFSLAQRDPRLLLEPGNTLRLKACSLKDLAGKINQNPGDSGLLKNRSETEPETVRMTGPEMGSEAGSETGSETQSRMESDGLEESFVIRSVMGKGSSAICYEAMRKSDGAIGQLKEFYPLYLSAAAKSLSVFSENGSERLGGSGLTADPIVLLERNADHSLEIPPALAGSYQKEAAAYLHAYVLLEQTIASDSSRQSLHNFIPHSSFYRGIPAAKPASLLQRPVRLSSVALNASSIPADQRNASLQDFIPQDSAQTAFMKMDQLRKLAGKPGHTLLIMEDEDLMEDSVPDHGLMMDSLAAGGLNVMDDLNAKNGSAEDGSNIDGHNMTSMDGSAFQACAPLYVWSQAPTGLAYDQWLDQRFSKADSAGKASELLLEIVQILSALSQCVQVLHTAGLLHLDLKPSNFLLPLYTSLSAHSGGICLFDINSLSTAKSASSNRMGSEGFCAPEVIHGKADNRSDLYALGCILYSSLLWDQPKIRLYTPDDFTQLEKRLQSSSLLKQASAGKDPRVHQALLDLLRQTLCPKKEQRIGSCSLLEEKLQELILHLLPYTISRSLLEDGQSFGFYEKKQESPWRELLLQKLLYEHPLFEALPESGETDPQELHVLVAGFDETARAFVDLALQTGQIRNTALHFHILCADPKLAKESYLQERPAAKWFLEIDEEEILRVPWSSCAPDEQEPYGHLHFYPVSQTVMEQEEFTDEIPLASYAYAFISLKNDEQSRKAAKYARNFLIRRKRYDSIGEDSVFAGPGSAESGALRHVVEETVPLVYVQREAGAELTGAIPLILDETISADDLSSDLETMAFQVHAAWSGICKNPAELHRQFLADPYAYQASCAFALSIPYKLHSLGLHWNPEQKEELAVLLQQWLQDPAYQDKFEELAWLEHKRWVLSLIVKGWSLPLDEQNHLSLATLKIDGKVRNEAHQTHPCLVPSTMPLPLQEESWKDDHHALWESGIIDPSLDPLDTISVQIHQTFMAQAEKLLDPLTGIWADVRLLSQQLVFAPKSVHQAFLAWNESLKKLSSSSSAQDKQHLSTLFGLQEKKLRNAIQQASMDALWKEQLISRLDHLQPALKIISESMMYRDYKLYDLQLLQKLPQILVQKPVKTMMLAMDQSQNPNSSPLFADPARLILPILKALPEEILLVSRHTSALEEQYARIKELLAYFDVYGLPLQVSLLLVDETSQTPQSLRRKSRRVQRIWKTLMQTEPESMQSRIKGVQLLETVKELEAYVENLQTELCEAVLFDEKFQAARHKETQLYRWNEEDCSLQAVNQSQAVASCRLPDHPIQLSTAEFLRLAGIDFEQESAPQPIPEQDFLLSAYQQHPDDYAALGKRTAQALKDRTVFAAFAHVLPADAVSTISRPVGKEQKVSSARTRRQMERELRLQKRRTQNRLLPWQKLSYLVPYDTLQKSLDLLEILQRYTIAGPASSVSPVSSEELLLIIEANPDHQNDLEALMEKWLWHLPSLRAEESDFLQDSLCDCGRSFTETACSSQIRPADGLARPKSRRDRSKVIPQLVLRQACPEFAVDGALEPFVRQLEERGLLIQNDFTHRFASPHLQDLLIYPDQLLYGVSYASLVEEAQDVLCLKVSRDLFEPANGKKNAQMRQKTEDQYTQLIEDAFKKRTEDQTDPYGNDQTIRQAIARKDQRTADLAGRMADRPANQAEEPAETLISALAAVRDQHLLIAAVENGEVLCRTFDLHGKEDQPDGGKTHLSGFQH